MFHKLLLPFATVATTLTSAVPVFAADFTPHPVHSLAPTAALALMGFTLLSILRYKR
jgi:hypothetical protein